MVSPALDYEIRSEVKEEDGGIILKPKVELAPVKMESSGIVLKPKHEFVAKSAAQIVREQHGK